VKKIAYCEVSAGEVIDRRMVSSLSSLEPTLGPGAKPARVAIEACREAWFVHATLTAWGNEVLVVDTTRSRKLGIGQHRRKNDRIDAEVMARAVESGGIPMAHVLLALLSPLQEQLAMVEQGLEELCALEPVVAQLRTVPGVGPIVAAQFVSVIDEAKRFRTAHEVESYLGLVPSEDTTGGKRRLGAITKHGNTYLRALLVQSAWSMFRQPGRTDPLQKWALAVAERRGKRIAIVALARRLAGVLWAMWRDDTVYDAELAMRSGVRGLRNAAQSIEFRAQALERAAAKLRQHRARPAKITEVTSSN